MAQDPARIRKLWVLLALAIVFTVFTVLAIHFNVTPTAVTVLMALFTAAFYALFVSQMRTVAAWEDVVEIPRRHQMDARPVDWKRIAAADKTWQTHIDRMLRDPYPK